MPTHADILDADEHALWLAVRSARRRVHGDRHAAVAVVAAAHGLDADELNTRIAAMKVRLVAAGVVATHQFFVVEHPVKHWAVANVVTGTDQHRTLVASGAARFDSLRFAYNAAAALSSAAELEPGDRARFAAVLRDVIAGDRSARHVERFDGYGDLVCARYRDTVGFGRDGDRSWTGTVAHASWIADAIEAGEVNTVDGRTVAAVPSFAT